ncbi:uncharacterized protein LOC100432704 isoform X2 [Pongo abelii]|uniref:uncharacterized protein LOC100432704 isoform X2 n=1 Tax=Pongo abelii TaxID=9601 RepID=UPI003006D272
MGLPASFPDSSPRRFDPAFQFLHKQVCVSHALGRIHRITAVSSLFPAASPASLKRAASLQTRSQSSLSLVSRWDFLQRCCARRGCRMHVAGEAAPDTVFSLGRGFCPDMAALKDADAVGISMKFPCEAVVSMDVSQHCADSCDQDVSQHCADSCDQDVSQHCADSCDQDVSQHCADSCDQDVSQHCADSCDQRLEGKNLLKSPKSSSSGPSGWPWPRSSRGGTGQLWTCPVNRQRALW